MLALLAPLATSLLTACGDSSTFTQVATTENVTVAGYVYALSGTSATLPAAYDMTINAFVRPIVQSNGAVNFEMAFDIDSAGRILLLPAKKISPLPPSPITGAPSVGFARTSTPYDLITKAVITGYTFDSVTVASVGETFYLELPQAGCVYGEPYYGKMVIDSMNLAGRYLYVRAMTNRNCGGYRALIDGIPKN